MTAIVKHTPGPWTSRAATASVPTTHVYGSTGHIASFTGRNHDANARLSVAGPDLLEALKSAARLIEANGFREWPGGSLAEIQTAIAKAEAQP